MFKKILIAFVAISALLLIFVLFLRPDLNLSAEEVKLKVLQPSSKFTTWKGNEVHYTDEGSGLVILMLHGFGGSFYNFQALTEKLKGEYRIIRVDLPGMGLSDFKQSSEMPDFFEEYKDFFATFLNQVKVDSMYVMGNSLGGAMACMVAAEHPEKVKKLILLNSAGYEMDKVIVKGAGPIRWNWFRPFLKKGIPLSVVEYSVTYPFADRSKVDKTEFPIDFALVNKKGNVNALFDLATSGQEPDTTLMKTIQCPTLIIWGKEDVIIPVDHAQKFKRDIPNSEVKIYSPCGHMPMMEIPDSIVADFKKFTAL